MRLSPKAGHSAWHRAGVQGLVVLPVPPPGRLGGAGACQGPETGGGAGARAGSSAKQKGHWSLFLQQSIPPVAFPSTTQSGLAGCAPQGYFHLPKPPQVSPMATSSQPRSLRPISLCTLVLVGPPCLQNEMMAAPRAHCKCLRKSLRSGWLPQDWRWYCLPGGCGCFYTFEQKRMGRACCSRLQLPIKGGSHGNHLLCLNEAQKWPVGPWSAAALALLTLWGCCLS